MKTLLITGLLLVASTSFASYKSLNSQTAPFKLAPLPYAADSLTKGIDAETMTVHHDKHHQAYVDNLNKAVDTKKKTTLLQLLQTASQQSPAVRNNAGGHWNHTFFWSVLSGKDADNQMPDRLRKEIEGKWGTVEKFKEEFETAGLNQFGSGWVWLIRTEKGLEIVTTPNQDNPLMNLADKRGWPVLGADVWEHAYYLKYQSQRADYLKGFWQVVSWQMVDQYDREATKTKMP